jgi:hypothetical protein
VSVIAIVPFNTLAMFALLIGCARSVISLREFFLATT